MASKMYSRLIDNVIDWASAGNPDDVDKWLYYCEQYLRRWGWNTNAVNSYIDWGSFWGFNNKHLHFETTVAEFYDEVEYCADRMDMDRLFRCHSMYRTLPKKTVVTED